jgi:hypothetical protein
VLSVPVLLELWPTSDYRPSWLGAAIALVGYLAFVVRGTGRLHKSPQVMFTLTAFLGFALSMPFLGADSVRIFAVAVPLIALPVALAVGILTGKTKDLTVGEEERGDRTSRGAWLPAWIGVALAAVLLVGTPIAMASTTRPAMARRRCPDGQFAQPLIGGTAVTVVARQSTSTRTIEEVGINDYLRDEVFAGPIDTLVHTIKPPTTIVDGLTRSGNDRIALVPGVVAAPQGSVLYLCGQVVRDAQGHSVPRYWNEPLDFFRATSVLSR